MNTVPLPNILKDVRIAVVGLGYVGLPLAIEFGKKYKVLGFDINKRRIAELKEGKDHTREVNLEELHLLRTVNRRSTDEQQSPSIDLSLSTNLEDLRPCNIYIVAVPTPIDRFKAPDLQPLTNASKMLGKVLAKGDIVIYESTVYPGCTEEVCVPLLERVSGLQFNKDFFAGYSPERINPGDKINTLTRIKKVTSGSTPEAADQIDKLYRSIIQAGTHKAPSLKVAEASKVIENAQRDVNISFVNELALIFDRMEINTYDVLEAAGTKWNFLSYKPGLVGGHCIGVDPYYLAHRAQQLGYIPNVLLSGRRVNEQMSVFVASKVVKLMVSKGIAIKGSRALIMGITFKENCPDIRNSGAIEVYHELIQFGITVDIYDPWADTEEVKRQYGVRIISKISGRSSLYDAIVVAVAHKEFIDFDYASIKSNDGVLFDTKACLKRELVDGSL